MEETLKGIKCSESTSIVSSSAASAPWLDLPDVLTDLVLERLDLRAYLRFAVVCRKWRSIQSDHRLRHFPSAPPMAPSFPWILPFVSNHQNPFLSLSDFAANRLPLLSTSDYVFSPFPGWLLAFLPVTCPEQRVYLFNPISGGRVQLPSLSPPISFPCAGVLSALPADPDCIALIIDSNNSFESILFCRVHGHGEWVKFLVSPVLDDPFCLGGSSNAIFCGGKFYFYSAGLFRVIDPIFPSPSISILDMDGSPGKHLRIGQCHHLVESNGEVLLVVAKGNWLCEIVAFRVFRADFSQMMWVMLEALGDRVLFVDDDSAFCLSTTEVGCKENLIYYTIGRGGHKFSETRAWRVFDLDSGIWTDGPCFSDEIRFPPYTLWFAPTLDSAANPL